MNQAEVTRQNLPLNAVNPLQTQLNALGEELASIDFLTDILTDVDGITLHRFQAFVWTLVLGVVFVVGAIPGKGMPDNFTPQMLALLGISGGAYLGFKIPEQPA